MTVRGSVAIWALPMVLLFASTASASPIGVSILAVSEPALIKIVAVGVAGAFAAVWRSRREIA